MLNRNNLCNGTYYTIKEGDTLYKISRKNNISLGEILEANMDVNIYNLQVGDKICLPKKMENDNMENLDDVKGKWFVYIVKEGDSLKELLEKFDVDYKDLLNLNNENKIQLKPGGVIVMPRRDNN